MEYLLRDFAKIEDISIIEELTQDDIDEGLEQMVFDFKVLFSYHSLKRINDPGSRGCEYYDVVKLLKDTPAIINQPMGQELRVLSKDRTLCVVCVMQVVEGELSIAIKTVISNVTYRNNEIVQRKISTGKGNYVIQ